MLLLISNLLDYIFHKKCYFCTERANKRIICDKCYEKLKASGAERVKTIKGVSIKGYYFYKGEVLKLIRGIKYHNKKTLAKEIAGIIVEIAGKEHFSPEKTEIIPVPMHHKRQQKRKYNHMEILAGEISLLTGCRVNVDLIKRVKNTLPQYNLNQLERRKNLKDAFRVFPEFYSGKTLVLFDDISTTGATLEVMIEELRKHNIRNITGLVIAFV